MAFIVITEVALRKVTVASISYTTVPEVWKDDPFGVATYRLRLENLIVGTEYALLVPYASTSDIVLLHLGFFFVAVGLTALFQTPGVPVFRLFPSLDWSAYQKLGYTLAYALPVFLLLFTSAINGWPSRKYVVILNIPILLSMLSILALPPVVFTRINPLYQIFAFIVYGSCFASYARAVFEKRFQARG